jgi:glycerol-3-phosphate dehydrogenase subunit B
MRTSFDVLVIGGGAAGVAAALHAHAAGAHVGVVRAAPGASAVGSGGWSGPLDHVMERALARAGLPHVAAPQPLPHPYGDLRTFDFAAESHAFTQPIDTALLCGIAGLGGFAAPALARMYATSGGPPLAHAVAVARGTPPAGWSPMSLAAALQRDHAIVTDALKPLITSSISHVLMPAVLGLDNASAVRDAMQDVLGVPVFECLGAPPSIPGWRLDRAFLHALRTAGIEIANGIVHGCDADNGTITRVHVSMDGVARTMHADRFVLATGKFLGGGIVTVSISAREQALVETALGMPVWIEHLDQTFTTAESLTLTSRVRTYDQPLLRAGVHVDGARAPLDARGRVLYRNLTVVGSVCAGVDAQHGLGHAAQSAALPEQEIYS